MACRRGLCKIWTLAPESLALFWHPPQRTPNCWFGLVVSRQRVSERRSPEQGENGSAGCWPQKIHPHTQLLQAQAKTRSTRKHPGCKQSRTNFAQSMGKKTTGRNNRPRLTASRIAKLSEDGPRFQPKLLRTGRYMPRLFIWKTQRLRSTATGGETQRLRSKPGPFFRNIPDISIVALQTIFPKYSGYFDDSISRNIWNVSGKWSLKYSEYFKKMVDGCDSRTVFRKAVRENARKCDEQVSRFRFIE